jgi:hypothetical protein
MTSLLRALALSLVVTGAVASTHIARNGQTAVVRPLSDLPVPTCAPDDPNGCGMCAFNGTCSSSSTN